MYRGRFAPSPTGALHFGSLVGAVASYLEASAHGGEWLLRIDDLDTPRTMAGAADGILRTLQAFGFSWHGAVVYQSQQLVSYASALQTLQENGLVYGCTCSRKEIADSATHGIDGLVYPGTCRQGCDSGKTARAWRLFVTDGKLSFQDGIQGAITQNIARDIGDFVLRRADGIYAYQLATVLDDAAAGITHVVRGADLLDSTPRQIYLQQALKLPTPHYAHVPVATNPAGEKLSKQTLARPLDIGNPTPALWLALDFLGQQPPAHLRLAELTRLWQWAKHHWQMAKIPQKRTQIFDQHTLLKQVSITP